MNQINRKQILLKNVFAIKRQRNPPKYPFMRIIIFNYLNYININRHIDFIQCSCTIFIQHKQNMLQAT